MAVTVQSPEWQAAALCDGAPCHPRDGTMGSPHQPVPGVQGSPCGFPWGFGVPCPHPSPREPCRVSLTHVPSWSALHELWGSACVLSSSCGVAWAGSSSLQGGSAPVHPMRVPLVPLGSPHPTEGPPQPLPAPPAPAVHPPQEITNLGLKDFCCWGRQKPRKGASGFGFAELEDVAEVQGGGRGGAAVPVPSQRDGDRGFPPKTRGGRESSPSPHPAAPSVSRELQMTWSYSGRCFQP